MIQIGGHIAYHLVLPRTQRRDAKYCTERRGVALGKLSVAQKRENRNADDAMVGIKRKRRDGKVMKIWYRLKNLRNSLLSTHN